MIRNRKRLFVGVLFAACLWTITAGRIPAQTATVDKETATEKPERLEKILRPFLWRINNKTNPDKPSWLFGTIHITDERVLEMHPAAREAFEESDTLFLEISPGDMFKQLGVLILRDGKKIENLLDAETLARLDAELTKISPILAGRHRANYKVWVWPIIIPSVEAQLKNTKQMILDVELAMRAKRAGKPVGGLEDPLTQLNGMDALTPDEQIMFLKDWLDSAEEATDEGRDQEAEMAELYVRGDMEELKTFIDEDMVSEHMSEELGEKIMKAMLYDRNQKMADTILRTLEKHPDKSHFFAAGTAHFVGEQGVQNLLRKQNVDAKRVATDKD